MKLVCNILYLEMTMIAHRMILKLYGQFAFTFVTVPYFSSTFVQVPDFIIT